MLDYGLSTDDLRRRLDSYLASHTVSLVEIEAIGQSSESLATLRCSQRRLSYVMNWRTLSEGT